MNVLIIDDSLAIRSRIVKSLLDVETIESILQCKSIPEAQNIFARFQPDVIITEFFLLNSDAVTMLQNMKHEKQSLKIIILTDDMYEPFLIKCKKAGATHILHKLHEFEKLPLILNGTYRSDPNNLLSTQKTVPLTYYD